MTQKNELTSSQENFLAHLYALQRNHPDGVHTPTGYANAVDYGGPGMQSMLRGLVKKGYIERYQCQVGEKIGMVKLTQKGAVLGKYLMQEYCE